MRVRIGFVLIFIAGVMLTGCAVTPISRTVSGLALEECQRAGVLDADGEFDNNFLRQLVNPGTEDFLIVQVDRFLDCAVAPVGPTYNTVDASGLEAFMREYEQDKELHLYRGHVVVALLSAYGRFNATGSVGGNINLGFRIYPELQEDAQSLLARIESAEGQLRGASGTGGLSDREQPVQPLLPAVEQLHRVLSVALVGIAAERPTYKRVNAFARLFIAGVSPSNVSETVRAGLNTIRKNLVLSHFGSAYLYDARRNIEAVRAQGGTPTLADWKRWDAEIRFNCAQIASIAQTEAHCIPGN